MADIWLYMAVKLKEQKKIQIVLEIDRKDFWTAVYYQDFINALSKRNNKIPTRILKKYFSLFTIKQSRINTEVKRELADVKEKLIQLYESKKYKSLGFDKESISNIPFDAIMQCSFRLLLDSIFNDFPTEVYLGKIKAVTLKYLFNKIEYYFSQYKEDTKKIFPKYRRDILICCILIELGFRIENLNEIPLIEIRKGNLSDAVKKETTALLKKKAQT